MEPDGMYLQVLRELANVNETATWIITERLWQLGKVPEEWKKYIVTAICKKEWLENNMLIGFILIPGMVTKHIFLEVSSKHIKDRKVTGKSARICEEEIILNQPDSFRWWNG